MPWISVEERLPPLAIRVPVAGDHIPMDGQGHFKYGCGHAARRLYPGDNEWYWASDQWRSTVGIRWWWEEGVRLPRP